MLSTVYRKHWGYDLSVAAFCRVHPSLPGIRGCWRSKQIGCREKYVNHGEENIEKKWWGKNIETNRPDMVSCLALIEFQGIKTNPQPIQLKRCGCWLSIVAWTQRLLRSAESGIGGFTKNYHPLWNSDVSMSIVFPCFCPFAPTTASRVWHRKGDHYNHHFPIIIHNITIQTQFLKLKPGFFNVFSPFLSICHIHY